MAKKSVGVTDFVCWFPNENDGVQPLPLIVEAVHGKEMIGGSVIKNGQLIFHQSIYHKDAAILKENPKLGWRNGVWCTRSEYDDIVLMREDAIAERKKLMSGAEKAPFESGTKSPAKV